MRVVIPFIILVSCLILFAFYSASVRERDKAEKLTPIVAGRIVKSIESNGLRVKIVLDEGTIVIDNHKYSSEISLK